MWILEGLEPDTEVFSFRMPVSAIKTLGRAERADFIVNAPMVSRLHCRIEAAEETLQVFDLESTNGTYINGERIARGELRDGDRLRIGRVDFKVSKTGTDSSDVPLQ